MRRKMIALFVTVLLTLTCSLTVFAQDFDPLKYGSVSVTLTEQHDEEPIVGANLNLYYVASVVIDTDGNLIYDCTEDFEQFNTVIADPSLAATLDAFVSDHNISSVEATTDENGTAIFENLALGLYFIRQIGTVEGFASCTPFMVTVPGKSAEGFVYEVNASPKTEVSRLTSITVKKVWNTDSTTEVTDSVTVQLLRNGNVIKTATLNARNNWQITYTGMPESDSYSIREIDVPIGFTATYSNTGYVFTVTNTPSLIQTGQLIWPIPVLAVSGMLLIAIGITLLHKKRKTNA